jgi:glycosyltransferase involved in cell wall biosynthesis
MRVNVHDYSGHPFQVQLSRELAARGHEVLHNYAAQYVSGHGRLTCTPDDPPTLRIEPVHARSPLVKYSPLRRIRFELDYAGAWQDMLDREPFDVVVSCNVPLFAVARMRRYFERRRQPWVFWHQDIYSLAIGAEATRRLPGPLATAARRAVEAMEARQVGSADGVVAITDAMTAQYRAWGLPASHAAVIPNWAPIDDIAPVARDNAWVAENGLPEGPLRLLYAGTLGRKHNPLLLLQMLDGIRARGVDAMLVVASEGEGADDLAAAAGERADVRVVGYQPAERFSEVLSSADAVVALLEPDAGRFSVPSKVLSYLSAGRAILALLPADNPAADDVRAAGGYVGPPDAAGAVGAADWIVRTTKDPAALEGIGLRARALAEDRFDIARIADRFEQAFERAAGRSSTRVFVPRALRPLEVAVEV